MAQKLTLLRLQKQTADLQRNPIENAFVARVGTLNFHFCLHSLHSPYKGGYYHGLLELHENYPFRAPKLFFYTPSGRFQIDVPICTSFTHYHQESWTSAWNVRTLIVATISFMYSDEPSFGCRQDSEAIRKNLAQLSKQHNMRNTQFMALFGQKIDELERNQPSLRNSNSSGEEMRNEEVIERQEILAPRQVLQNRLDFLGRMPVNRAYRCKTFSIFLFVLLLVIIVIIL